MTSTPTSIIDTIDQGLSGYYKELKRNYHNDAGRGRFIEFVEENELDDDIIEEELADNPQESTLVDFDSEFPLDPPIEDEEERNKEIHRILNCMKDGRFQQKPKKMVVEIDICKDVNTDTIRRSTAKYHKQMISVNFDATQNPALMYYLGVGQKEKYPFLTYMVDSFTNDKAKTYESKGESITLRIWVAKSKFMQSLKKDDPTEAAKLKQAMDTYMKRTMNRLKLTTIFEIEDDLESVAQYVVAMPSFITKLMDHLKGLPPFHIDLLIAVNKVMCTVGDDMNKAENKTKDADDEDDDDYDDYDDKQSTNPDVDHIGDITERLKGLNIHSCKPSQRTREDGAMNVPIITRILTTQYNEFRSVLHPSAKFIEDTYPQNRRFSILIDRRKGENITFFEPPDHCNEMENDHVPEIGFEFVRKCLIPAQKKEDYITALDGICGQLLSFIFHVEERDNIRCYLIWNSQTMRFQGEHLTQILPILFAKTKENTSFKAEQVKTREMQKMFNAEAQDETFNAFYNEVRTC